MPRIRFTSLFWTFTGSFLVVLVLSAVLQAFVLVAVMRPIAKRSLQGEAAVMLQKASRRLAAVEGTDERLADLKVDTFKAMIEQVVTAIPNFKARRRVTCDSLPSPQAS